MYHYINYLHKGRSGSPAAWAARTYVPCFANALTYNQTASSIGADEHNGEPARAGATHAGLHRA